MGLSDARNRIVVLHRQVGKDPFVLHCAAGDGNADDVVGPGLVLHRGRAATVATLPGLRKRTVELPGDGR